MPKYAKFVFQELPKSSVVNMQDRYDIDYLKEDAINQVVTQHLSAIIGEANDGEVIENEDALPEINIEEIKLESYNKGLEDAKVRYEGVISELHTDNDFAQILQEKIAEICPKQTLDSEIAKLSSQIIENIAKKIYLILPIDFEQILRNGMLARLKKFYKEGEIKLIIHPGRYDFCTNILQSENLPAKFRENFQIIKDDKMNIDDCKLEWQDTCLEYNQEQLSSEIDKILEQLKSIA